MKLLTKETAKLAKTHTDAIQSMILYLDPLYNKDMCKGASAGCRKACLINSGMMRMPAQTNARKARTKLYWDNNEAFIHQLIGEIKSAAKSAAKSGKKLDVRLNGTSDLDWSEIYALFPDVQFHEYTKRPELAQKLAQFDNVHVTFSKHENHTIEDVKRVLFKGINVAVVFNGIVPNKFKGLDVIDGDAHDRRWEDDKGKLVGLKLKGTNDVKAFAIRRGFAV